MIESISVQTPSPMRFHEMPIENKKPHVKWGFSVWRGRDSDPRPNDYEPFALPTELPRRIKIKDEGERTMEPRGSAFSIPHPSSSSGARTRTGDLWVMSPTSCHCSTPQSWPSEAPGAHCTEHYRRNAFPVKSRISPQAPAVYPKRRLRRIEKGRARPDSPKLTCRATWIG